MFVVHTNLFFFLALSKYEMLFLNPLINVFGILEHLSCPPCSTVQVCERLETRSPAPRSKSYELFPIGHAPAAVRQSTAIFKLVIELGHIPRFRPIVSEGRPGQISFHRSY